MNTMVALRRSLERDPFGIASHLLTIRNGCTAVRCDAFPLFTDTTILQVNLKGRVFEGYVRRHADDWKEDAVPVAKAPDGKPAGEAAAPQAPGQVSGTPGHMPTKFDFPSAASIPLALAEAIDDGRIKPGQLLLLEAMGGGFTWGACVLRL